MVRRTITQSICDNQYGTDEAQAGIYGSKYDPITKRTYFCGYFSAVGYPVGFVAADDFGDDSLNCVICKNVCKFGEITSFSCSSI